MSFLRPNDTKDTKVAPRRSRLIQPIIAFGITALVAAGVIVTAVYLSSQRHAPGNAAFSRTANPQFYTELADIRNDAPSFASKRDALAKQPVAVWLPTNTTDAIKAISRAVQSSQADGTIPIFVSYAIPNRDLGGQSAGGLDAAGYRAYIAGISEAIGDAPAVVIVEPDALAHLPDMKGSARSERITLLSGAIDTLYANPKTAVYLDAGNSAWRSAGDTAGLILLVATVSKHGVPAIALNVSNYQPTSKTQMYAGAIEAAYGKKLYVMIDTSRNGGSTDSGDWCNPSGQRLGTASGTFDRNARIQEAFIKTPGESDGSCGISNKAAGEFDQSLLLQQLLG